MKAMYDVQWLKHAVKERRDEYAKEYKREVIERTFWHGVRDLESKMNFKLMKLSPMRGARGTSIVPKQYIDAPVDQTPQYDKMLDMLTHTTNKQIELTFEEYEKFVNGVWSTNAG